MAERIRAALGTLPGVRRAFLRGSLARGRTDELSDIDVGIDVSGEDNGAFAVGLPASFARLFPVEFWDWTTALLPGAYVQTYFLQGQPLFWHVDVEISATPHVASVSREHAVQVQDRTDHFTKLWVLTAKHLLRGLPEAPDEARRLAARVLTTGAGDPDDRPVAELMRAVLDDLAARSPAGRGPFLERCAAVCARIDAAAT